MHEIVLTRCNLLQQCLPVGSTSPDWITECRHRTVSGDYVGVCRIWMSQKCLYSLKTACVGTSVLTSNTDVWWWASSLPTSLHKRSLAAVYPLLATFKWVGAAKRPIASWGTRADPLPAARRLHEPALEPESAGWGTASSPDFLSSMTLVIILKISGPIWPPCDLWDFTFFSS